MTVMLVVAIIWLAIPVPLALLVGRAISLADLWETHGRSIADPIGAGAPRSSWFTASGGTA